MKKSYLKLVLGIVAILLINATFYFFYQNKYFEIDGFLISSFIICEVFLFSLAVRKIAWFKPYFTSKYNFLTSKVRNRQEFDFSKDILFEKLKDVMQVAGFKIIQTNENTGDIFATSPISWSSWGENIYITLKQRNDKTIVDFCSASFFQVYAWGKNKRNYENLLTEFEKSLII